VLLERPRGNQGLAVRQDYGVTTNQPPAPPRCYVHDDRLAGSVCARCGKPICPDCMHEAPVGWHCTNCLKQGARSSPVRRVRPRSPGRLGNTRPTPVVIALIVINVAVFIWEESNLTSIERRFGMWPNGVHYFHQWYRLITSPFLHASFAHIALNMLTLLIIGPPVEAEIGPFRFTALYLVAALGGSVGSYLLSPASVLGVGASGAIFGVMGAYFVLARRRGWDTSTILALIIVNLVLGFTESGIDWRAHLGGLVTGGVVAYGLSLSSEHRRTGGWGGTGGGSTALVLTDVAVFVVVAGVLGLLALLPPGHVNL
jgi:membrane associated rhomboid family serine protease